MKKWLLDNLPTVWLSIVIAIGLVLITSHAAKSEEWKVIESEKIYQNVEVKKRLDVNTFAERYPIMMTHLARRSFLQLQGQ